MAFNQTSISAKYLEMLGSQPKIVYGISALSGGTATITVPAGRRVVTAWAESQTSNAARVSATDGSTLTLTGTGTDVVAWFAIVT
jgi:hypothetical protein